MLHLTMSKECRALHFFLQPLQLFGAACTPRAIFLLIYFLNQYRIPFGTNKVVVVVVEIYWNKRGNTTIFPCEFALK